MPNPLDQFRSLKGMSAVKPQIAATDLPQTERELYRAFGTSQSNHHLQIRRLLSDEDRAPSYATLQEIITDRRTVIGLLFPIMTVWVWGRNLHDLYLALLRHEVQYMQMIDQSRWAEPNDPEAAVITRIEIQVASQDKTSPVMH